MLSRIPESPTLTRGAPIGTSAQTEVMPKAKAAVEKALELNPDLAEAHASLGQIKFEYDYDWAGAEREFRRAIEINPNYAAAHDQYGVELAYLGKVKQSEAEGQRATELDPLSAAIWMDAGLAPTIENKFEAAREFARKALYLDPNFLLARAVLGWVDLQAGEYNQAIPELQKADIVGAPPFVQGWIGYAYARVGQRDKAETVLAQLKDGSAHSYVSPYCLAMVYLGRGETQQALTDLEKAYEIRSQWLDFTNIDKMYEPLRSEPRFIALLKKVGLDK